MPLSDMLEEKAKKFAEKAHNGQTRWDGVTPYFNHLQDVNKLLKSFKFTMNNDLILTVGWLHDIIEDTDITIDEITKIFGEDVAYLVNEMTHKEDQSDEEYIRYVTNMTSDCMLVKMADILTNIGDTTSKKSNHFVAKRLTALVAITAILAQRGVLKLEY